MNMNRNPGGTPTGGQFAATDHAEADGVSLTDGYRPDDEKVLNDQVEQYLDLHDYADVEAWARDSNYLLTDDGWVDDDDDDDNDNPVDLDAQLAGALEACEFQATEDMTYEECDTELDEIGRGGTSKRHDALLGRQEYILEARLEEVRDERAASASAEQTTAAIASEYETAKLRVMTDTLAVHPEAKRILFTDTGSIPSIHGIELNDGTVVPPFHDDEDAGDRVAENLGDMVYEVDAEQPFTHFDIASNGLGRD